MSTEKNTKKPKEASVRAQLNMLSLDFNKHEVKILSSGKAIKIRPLTAAPQSLLSGFLVKQLEVDIENPSMAEAVSKSNPNIKLQCKAIAMAILSDGRMKGFAGLFKVKLFHWLLWRKVFWTFNQQDITETLIILIEKLGLQFFFQNMRLTKEMNTLRKKTTKKEKEAEVKQSVVEQK